MWQLMRIFWAVTVSFWIGLDSFGPPQKKSERGSSVHGRLGMQEPDEDTPEV